VTAEDGTTISRAFSGKTMRVLRNANTEHYAEHPEELKAFPEQLWQSLSDGTFHLGGGEDTPGVDPEREGYPAGQGVGGIDELVPPGSSSLEWSPRPRLLSGRRPLPQLGGRSSSLRRRLRCGFGPCHASR